MFSRRPLDLTGLNPSSKLALKLSCLEACRNDVKEATALYDFIAGGMDLPDIVPPPPSAFEQFKAGAGNALGWVQEHKDDLLQGYQFLRSLRAPASVAKMPADVPPIPNE